MQWPRRTLTNTASRRHRPCRSAARRCRARSSDRAATAASSPASAFSRSSAAHSRRRNRATAAPRSRGIVVMRHALPVVVAIHVVDQPADIFAGEIAFQRPGRVGVAEGRREIGHVGIHHALVVAACSQKSIVAAVDAHLHAAQHLQHEAGGGDDDVGLKLAAVLQTDAAFGESIDLVGDDGGALSP